MDLPRPPPPDTETLPKTPAAKKPAAKRKFTKKLSVKGRAKAIARQSATRTKAPKR
jgi:hypothetical protein